MRPADFYGPFITAFAVSGQTTIIYSKLTPTSRIAPVYVGLGSMRWHVLYSVHIMTVYSDTFLMNNNDVRQAQSIREDERANLEDITLRHYILESIF